MTIMSAESEVRAAVVVAVGREVQQVPVGLDRWREVRQQTGAVLSDHGWTFTEDAVGHGVWNGRAEESVTVAGEVRPSNLVSVLFAAGDLAQDHQQDAVAVTVGVTVLVGAADQPFPEGIGAQLRELADLLDPHHIGATVRREVSA
jgi:hypothetical protein